RAFSHLPKRQDFDTRGLTRYKWIFDLSRVRPVTNPPADCLGSGSYEPLQIARDTIQTHVDGGRGRLALVSQASDAPARAARALPRVQVQRNPQAAQRR